MLITVVHTVPLSLQAVHAASRGLDLDYDSAMLTVLKNEADAIEKELARYGMREWE